MKCDQYWPARGTETYGLIQVTLLDTVELATYTVRTFALHKVQHPQSLSPTRALPRSDLSTVHWGWMSENLVPEPGAQRRVSTFWQPVSWAG